MADSSFFTDGGSGSGTFQTIETKIAEAEAAKVAAQAAKLQQSKLRQMPRLPRAKP